MSSSGSQEPPCNPVGTKVPNIAVLDPNGQWSAEEEGTVTRYKVADVPERMPATWRVEIPFQDHRLGQDWVLSDWKRTEVTTMTPNVVQERFDFVLERAVRTHWLPQLFFMAALEEALQHDLSVRRQQQQQQQSTSNTATLPSYYTTAPSSASSVARAAASPQPIVTTTPAQLLQRIKVGCTLALEYRSYQLDQINGGGMDIATGRPQRQVQRALRQRVTPKTNKPHIVQKGGRVALWLLEDGWKQQHEEEVPLDGTDDPGAQDSTQEPAVDAMQDVVPTSEEPAKSDRQESEATTVADDANHNKALQDTNDSTEDISVKNGTKVDPSTATESGNSGEPTKKDAVAGGSRDATNESGKSEVSNAKEDPETSKDEPAENEVSKNEAPSPAKTDEAAEPESEDDSKSADAEKDDDYNPEQQQESDEEDEKEELQDLVPEKLDNLKEDRLDTTSRDGNEPADVVEDEEEEEEEIAYDELLLDNPYFEPTQDTLLEFLGRMSKSLAVSDLQAAEKIGMVVSKLLPVDQVVLKDAKGTAVIEDLTKGKMDAATYGRSKVALLVKGGTETPVQEQKQERDWAVWRFKGIHAGCTQWPMWLDTVKTKRKDVQNNLEARDMEMAKNLSEQPPEASTGLRRTTRRGMGEGVFYGNQSGMTQKQLMDTIVRLVKQQPHCFHTLMGLQELLADDSSNPIRRTRTALGKLVWKRNQLSRLVVSAESDEPAWKALEQGPLVVVEMEKNGNSRDTALDSVSDAQRKSLISYMQSLHETELKLRALVLEHLTEIPVAIVATAADERAGSMESMDAADFEDPSKIEWQSSGHNLLNALIYRPSIMEMNNDLAPCYWYSVQDYSSSIDSTAEDEGPSVDRRMRFRAVPVPAPDMEEDNGTEIAGRPVLILTEAQVHAGIKAADLEAKKSVDTPSASNPFSNGFGARITMTAQDKPEQAIDGKVVGYDSVDQNGSVEHRILVLTEHRGDFWVILDVPEDGSTVKGRKMGDSMLYTIEQFDYHSASPAFRECKAIIDFLEQHPKAGPFFDPVDPVALNIPDYFDVIKNPMDISTVSKKLDCGAYSIMSGGLSGYRSPIARMLNGPFRQDIELIFDNAMLFNPPGDWIHKAAATLKKAVLKKIDQASGVADSKTSGGGRGRYSRQSIYVADDSDVDMYEYESDNDDEDYAGQKKNRKRKRQSRGGTTKDDYSFRAIAGPVRLQNAISDSLGLKGLFANFPVNTDPSSFSLSPEWRCRYASAGRENALEDPSPAKKQLQEITDLIALQQQFEETESAALRRSTRSHHQEDTPHILAGAEASYEFYIPENTAAVLSPEEASSPAAPSNRVEIENVQEDLHESYYAKIFKKVMGRLGSSKENGDGFGVYENGFFPPYLGRVIPVSSDSVTWEIRSPFVVTALRWVIRGLVQSGHLHELEPMVLDSPLSSGMILANNVYCWDPSLEPFEVLNLKELQRRKRASTADGDEESEEDIELSEYEKLRAERVARNAERLKALGLA